MKYEYLIMEKSESFPFLMVPKYMLKSKEFENLSRESFLLYSLLYKRVYLFRKNNWVDSDGKVYIYYTLKEIQEDLRCSEPKAVKLLDEPYANKGIELIARSRQGLGRPNKICVMKFA